MRPPTLETARDQFFRDSGIPKGGDYDAAWVEANFGPFPYTLPNSAARARALRVHDLHHPIAGYAADWRAESEISAWELGSGGAGPFWYGWFIALFGFALGLIALPKRTWTAFRAGRRTRNLYRAPYPQALLNRPLDQVQRALARPTPPGRVADAVAFARTAAVALPLGGLLVAMSPLLALWAMWRRATALPSARCRAAHAAP